MDRPSEAAESPLQQHFARHNRRVIGLALMTLLAAAAAWALVYFVFYWLVLLAMTFARPFDAQVPWQFGPIFAAGALLLCALCWLARRIWPDERVRDKKTILETALDVVLAVPRMTLAAWGNFRALRRLDADEVALAQRLLAAIAREERLSIYKIPLEIPDEKTRVKVLLALQLTELIETRRRDGELLFVLHGDKARFLAEPRVRLRTPP